MSETKAIMFYDGGCSLCSREVGWYRRLDIGNRIEFIDLTRDASLLTALGVSTEAAMRRLHVLSPDGVMNVGAYAFTMLWRQIPGLRLVPLGLYRLRLMNALDRLYERFARFRYRRRCQPVLRRVALRLHRTEENP